MTLQTKTKTIGLRRLILTLILLAAASVSASAQTNTFPASGNAGVGTTTPTLQSGTTNTMVEVKGTVNPGVGLTSTAAGGRQYYVYSSQANPGYFSVFDATAGADRFVIGSSGNVGVGTAGPAFPLEVSKSQAATTYIQVTNSNTSTGNAAAMRMFTSGNNALTLSASGNAGAGGYAAITQEANLPLLFQTNLTERMRITGGGNVGIGTASPDTWAKLHVYNAAGAGIDVQSASAASWSRLRLVTGTRTYGWFAGDSSQPDAPNKIGLYDYTAGAFRMMFDSSGNVGVGTANPNYKLDVNGEINATGIRINGTPISGGGSSQWTGTSSIYYNGGNVGIGTTSPDKKLVVVDGASLYLKFLRSSNDGLYMYADGNYYGLNAYDFTSQQYKPMSIGWGQQNLYLARDGGNVGIGTTSPGDRLVVRSSGSESATTIDADAAQQSTLYFSSAGSKKTAIYRPSNSNDLRFNIVGVGDALTLQTGTGNVGIGTASPASGYKLDVNGNTNVTGNLNVTGSINAKYQDLAEWVPSSEQLSAGTVVVLDATKSNQVISSGTAYDTRVAGVISAQPGITLGESGEGKVLVATTGRVRVKVDASRGAIQIGDLLVTSDVLGVAMKSEPVEFAGRKMHMPGTIIGKALEPLAKGSGEILVLLSLQ